MIKPLIQNRLQTAIQQLGYPIAQPIQIELPKNKEFGDFATNIAFLLAKPLKQNPKQIAEQLCDQLSELPELADSFTFRAINGFINLSFTEAYLISVAARLLDQKPEFSIHKEKILLEYVSANPTGPLHIGHGRWAVLGSVIHNLLCYIGADISTEFYINDAGTQIDLFLASVEAVRIHSPIPEGGYHGEYVHQLAGLSSDPVAEMVRQQKQTLDQLAVRFDTWFFEKTLHQSDQIPSLLNELRSKNLVYESEGALWFRSESFGDSKDRVLVKSDGNYTYFAVDIAYHWQKVQRGFDRIINIWGADHHGYIARMRAALVGLGGEKFQSDNYFNILIGQLVSLFRDGEPVRMSKRTGDMISLSEVIDEIGKDATRYFLVEKSADTHLDFDLELAKKKSNDNPVFYVQYAHARICSIQSKVSTIKPHAELFRPLHPTERAVLLHSIMVYDEIYSAATTFSPHRICQYLYQLARLFHHFYENCPIAKADLPDQQFRLFLIQHIQKILELGLSLLGVSAPQRM